MEQTYITKTGKKVIFRLLKVSDIEEALKYINSLSKEDTFILYSGEEISREDELKWLEDTEKKLKEKIAIRIGAFYNNKLIGTCEIRSLGRREKHVGNFGLSINKEFRGEGIGTSLMEFVLKLGKEYLNLRTAALGVFANNPGAKHIYQKLGFIEYGTLPEGLFYKGNYIDHIYMYKKLA